MRKKLLLLSFVEGAAVMAAELCGAKLLAPVYGSSLYVWASVMGLTLGALAFGYFFGGYMAERRGDRTKKLFLILNLAALFMILMPVLSYYLVPRISYLPFLIGVVLSTGILLFPPIFFLGASSPLFIAIQTNSSESAGKISGTVYAVSTLGGIFATFLCGFYLIPELGLNYSLLVFGILLFVLNNVILKLFKSFHLFLVLGFAYLNFQFINQTVNSLFYSDSLLGRISVEEDLVNNKRLLLVNGIVQTEMDLETNTSASRYMKLLDTLLPFSSTSKNALVLGLGGGLAANVLTHKNYRTDGVEFDQRIMEAASNYFFLDKRVATFCEDARYFLNKIQKKYDVVFVDVFKAEEQPSHILTLESLEHLKRNLSDSALLLINWHGYTSGAMGKGTVILFNTLRTAGYNVKFCSYSSEQNHRNVIIVASLHTLPKLPFQLDEELVLTSGINSDDQPLLEKYNAAANKTWRNSYLRYYQNKK